MSAARARLRAPARRITAVAACLAAAACTYTANPYPGAGGAARELGKGTTPVAVVERPPAFDDDGWLDCRGGGVVQVPGGGTFSEYIANALRQDLRSAQLSDESSSQIAALTVTKVNLSSAMGAANWYINAVYDLGSERAVVNTIYNDRSSFAGHKACTNMALYFEKAVARHLAQLYETPEFARFIGIGSAAADRPLTVEQRLEALEQLKAKGLISDEEYTTKRQAILGEL